MQEVVTQFEQTFRKDSVTAVKSGDTVRVHQTIREGGKERVQVFEGMVIRTRRQGSLTASITVRRITGGIGVEKTFMLHSPNVVKVEVVRRSKVRRNFLGYMRERQGKSARLRELGFDRKYVNEHAARAEAAKSTEGTREEEISTEISSEASKQEIENAKVKEPKQVEDAGKTATVDNAAKTKEVDSKKE